MRLWVGKGKNMYPALLCLHAYSRCDEEADSYGEKTLLQGLHELRCQESYRCYKMQKMRKKQRAQAEEQADRTKEVKILLDFRSSPLTSLHALLSSLQLCKLPFSC